MRWRLGEGRGRGECDVVGGECTRVVNEERRGGGRLGVVWLGGARFKDSSVV